MYQGSIESSECKTRPMLQEAQGTITLRLGLQQTCPVCKSSMSYWFIHSTECHLKSHYEQVISHSLKLFLQKMKRKILKSQPLCVACTYTVVMLFFSAYAIFIKYYVIGHSCYTTAVTQHDCHSCYTYDCSLSLSHNTQRLTHKTLFHMKEIINFEVVIFK